MRYPFFRVCVRCFTYNQSKYILDALNGFVMQETDFPFVCCIVDDASTDGEQDVIRTYIEENFDTSDESCYCESETDYAHITYARHKTNRNCYFAVLYLKNNHYSIKKDKIHYLSEWIDGCEYEALCEGDDYWIDCHKLQEQVTFLDGNPNSTMCVHNCYERRGDTFSEHSMMTCDGVLPISTIIDLWAYIPTQSIVFRRIIFDCSEYHEFRMGCDVGDGPLQIYAAMKGDVWYINKRYSVYRVCAENSWSESMSHDVERQLRHHASCIKWIKHANHVSGGKYHKYFAFTKSRRCFMMYLLSRQYLKIFFNPKALYYYLRHCLLPSVKQHIVG